jgi:hypothetical protein
MAGVGATGDITGATAEESFSIATTIFPTVGVSSTAMSFAQAEGIPIMEEFLVARLIDLMAFTGMAPPTCHQQGTPGLLAGSTTAGS